MLGERYLDLGETFITKNYIFIYKYYYLDVECLRNKNPRNIRMNSIRLFNIQIAMIINFVINVLWISSLR